MRFPVGAGVVWMWGGDACVALAGGQALTGSGRGRRKRPHPYGYEADDFLFAVDTSKETSCSAEKPDSVRVSMSVTAVCTTGVLSPCASPRDTTSSPCPFALRRHVARLSS